MSKRIYSKDELKKMVKETNDMIARGKEIPFYDTMNTEHQKKGGKILKMWLDDKDRVKVECEFNGKRVIADASPS